MDADEIEEFSASWVGTKATMTTRMARWGEHRISIRGRVLGRCAYGKERRLIAEPFDPRLDALMSWQSTSVGPFFMGVFLGLRNRVWEDLLCIVDVIFSQYAR